MRHCLDAGRARRAPGRRERGEQAREGTAGIAGTAAQGSIVVVDEAWAILANLAVARWFQATWKLSRAWGVANVAVLHRLSDLTSVGAAGSEQVGLAEGLLSDSETRVIYAQPTGEVAAAGSLLGLSDTESELIPHLGRGVALWKVGARSFLVQHLLGPSERALVDTDGALPGDMALRPHRRPQPLRRLHRPPRPSPGRAPRGLDVSWHVVGALLLFGALAGGSAIADRSFVRSRKQSGQLRIDTGTADASARTLRDAGTGPRQDAVARLAPDFATPWSASTQRTPRTPRTPRPPWRSRTNSVSPARWAQRRDLGPLLVPGPVAGRVVIGRCGRRLVAAEAGHSLLVVGPTQSGKTTGLAAPVIREWKGPVVAASVKGDLAEVDDGRAVRRGRGVPLRPSRYHGLPRACVVTVGVVSHMGRGAACRIGPRRSRTRRYP